MAFESPQNHIPEPDPPPKNSFEEEADTRTKAYMQAALYERFLSTIQTKMPPDARLEYEWAGRYKRKFREITHSDIEEKIREGNREDSYISRYKRAVDDGERQGILEEIERKLYEGDHDGMNNFAV